MNDPLSIHVLVDEWARAEITETFGSCDFSVPEIDKAYRASYEKWTGHCKRLPFEQWASREAELANPAEFAKEVEAFVWEWCELLIPLLKCGSLTGVIEKVVFDTAETDAVGEAAFHGRNEARLPDGSFSKPIPEIWFGRDFLNGVFKRSNGALTRSAARPFRVLIHELIHGIKARNAYENALADGKTPLEAHDFAERAMGTKGPNAKLHYYFEEMRAESGAQTLAPSIDPEMEGESQRYHKNYMLGARGILNRHASQIAKSTVRNCRMTEIEARLKANMQNELHQGQSFGGLLIGADVLFPAERPRQFDVRLSANRGEGSLAVTLMDDNVGACDEAVRSVRFPSCLLRSALQVVWPTEMGMPAYLDGSESGLASGSPDGWAVHPALLSGLAGLAAWRLEELPLYWNAGGGVLPPQGSARTLSDFGRCSRWDVGRILYTEQPQRIDVREGRVRALPTEADGHRFQGQLQTLTYDQASAEIRRTIEDADRVSSFVHSALFGTRGKEENVWRQLNSAETAAVHESCGGPVWEQFLEAVAICRWLRASGLTPNDQVRRAMRSLQPHANAWSMPGPYYSTQARPTGVGTFIRDACLNATAEELSSLRALVIQRSHAGIEFARVLTSRKLSKAPQSDQQRITLRLTELFFQVVQTETGVKIEWAETKPEVCSERQLSKLLGAPPFAAAILWLSWLTRSAIRLGWGDMLRRPYIRFQQQVAAGLQRNHGVRYGGADGDAAPIMGAEIIDLRSLANAETRESFESACHDLDDATAWNRGDVSDCQAVIVDAESPPPGTPPILMVCEPSEANDLIRQHHDLSAMERWTSPKELPRRLRRQLQCWIGPEVFSLLKCPASIRQVVKLRAHSPFDTRGVSSRPEDFSTSGIKPAMHLGGECNAQALTTAGLGLALGIPVRVCYGATLTSPMHRGTASVGQHMWTELLVDGVPVVCDDFGTATQRFYMSTRTLNRPAAPLMLQHAPGSLVGVVTENDSNVRYAADETLRPGNLLAMQRLPGSFARNEVRSTDAEWLAAVLKLMSSGCCCSQCLDLSDRSPLLALVVAGLLDRQFTMPAVDAVLTDLLVPGPFGLLVADELARAVVESEDVPILRWAEPNRCASMVNAAKEFRVSHAQMVRKLRTEASRYTMSNRAQSALDP